MANVKVVQQTNKLIERKPYVPAVATGNIKSFDWNEN